MTRPFRCIAPLLIVLSLSFTSSAFSGETSPKPKSFSMAVKVGIPVFGANSMPLFIAKEKGFYEEQGLKVEFILIQASVSAVATTSGQIDFTGAVGISLR